uniref:G-protein coupled receptors family 1 profile domain-containing protein n=1 Tax=Denticeps clupeoides TaxID=299321 RepID=A0AAY4F1I7_9TELE
VALEEMTEVGTIVACVILGLSFLVGTPGNLLVIWTIIRHVRPRSHTVELILHLAIADLLVLITLPLWIYSLLQSWIFGKVTCKALTYVIYTCMYSSVFLITIMSVERFVAVRYPFISAGWRRKKALRKLLIGVWAFAFLLSVPVILTRKLENDSCQYEEYDSPGQEVMCLLLETLVGFVVPFSVMVICYSCLYSRIAQMTFKSKRKSTGLTASVVLLFAICWIPHHVGNIISLVLISIQRGDPDAGQNLETVRSAMTFIAGALAFVSSTVNPVLYVFAARSFRSSLRETGIQKLFRHISGSHPGEGTKEMSFVSRRQNSQTQSSACCTESNVPADIDICNQG